MGTDTSPDEPPASRSSGTSWWTTLPGVLTGLAALLTAAAGLVAVLRPAPTPEAADHPPAAIAGATTPPPSSAATSAATIVPPAPAEDDRARTLALFSGRWRFPGDASCQARYGVVAIHGDTVSFTWRLASGAGNTANEHIEQVEPGLVTTRVLADDSPTDDQTGHRIVYTVSDDAWSSRDLETQERASHRRC